MPETDKTLTAWTALRHAGLLCLTAGFVDAYGYFDLGHVFIANMTGNTVFLGIGLASGNWEQAADSAVAIGAFLLGATIASALRHRFDRAAPWFLISAVLLAPIDVAPLPRRSEIAIMAIAMGIQGASLSQFGPARLRTVVVTGTLLRVADTLGGRWFAAPSREQDKAAGLGIGTWAAYAAGAALGVTLAPHTRPQLLFAIVLLILIAADVARSERAAA